MYSPNGLNTWLHMEASECYTTEYSASWIFVILWRSGFDSMVKDGIHHSARNYWNSMKFKNREQYCLQMDHWRNRRFYPRLVWAGGGDRNSSKRKSPGMRKNVPKVSTLSSRSPDTMLLLSCRNILYHLLLCAVLLLCLSCQTAVCQDTCSANVSCFPDSENLALAGTGRSLDVSTTCGTPEITLYTKDEQLLDRQLFICDDSNSSARHPPEFMIDTSQETVALQPDAPVTYSNPNAQTYWQSDNSRTETDGVASAPTEEWILLNLTDPFLVRYIRIIYVSPHIDSETSRSDMRPKAMCIERRASLNDPDWQPWRYYAEDCAEAFPNVVYQNGGITTPATTPVCIQSYYAGDSNTDVNYGYGRQEVSEVYCTKIQHTGRCQLLRSWWLRIIAYFEVLSVPENSSLFICSDVGTLNY